MRRERQPVSEIEKKVSDLRSRIINNLKATEGWGTDVKWIPIAYNSYSGERESLILDENNNWGIKNGDNIQTLGKPGFNQLLKHHTRIADHDFKLISDKLTNSCQEEDKFKLRGKIEKELNGYVNTNREKVVEHFMKDLESTFAHSIAIRFRGSIISIGSTKVQIAYGTNPRQLEEIRKVVGSEVAIEFSEPFVAFEGSSAEKKESEEMQIFVA